jgi:hypothetical protein
MKKRTFSTLLFILTAPWFLTGQPGNGSAKRLDCLAHYISFYDSINPSLVNFYDVSIVLEFR